MSHSLALFPFAVLLTDLRKQKLKNSGSPGVYGGVAMRVMGIEK